MVDKPFSYAKVAICSGDQGSGKSNTIVARAIDAAIASIVGLQRVSDGFIYKVSPLSKEEKIILKEKGYVLSYDTIKLYLPDGSVKITSIPPKHIILPSIRIFPNFHLYGVEYSLCTIAQIVEWLDAGIIRDGRLLIDEYHIAGNARDSMTSLGKALSKYSFTYRKRHLNVDIACAHEKLADFTARLVVTEHISCINDPETNNITLTITGKGHPRPKEVTYWGKQYWKYYNTDELFRLPGSAVEKAVAQAR